MISLCTKIMYLTALYWGAKFEKKLIRLGKRKGDQEEKTPEFFTQVMLWCNSEESLKKRLNTHDC